jgi:hypothetical protein
LKMRSRSTAAATLEEALARSKYSIAIESRPCEHTHEHTHEHKELSILGILKALLRPC